MPSHETVISVLPGDTENERLQIVLSASDKEPKLSIRQQTFGSGIGWYTQSTVTLSLSQLSGLQLSLCAAKSLGAPRHAFSQVESGSDDDRPVLIPFPGPASAGN